MDIINIYNNNIFNNTTIGNYRIINKNNSTEEYFLLNDNKLVLNSHTILNLLKYPINKLLDKSDIIDSYSSHINNITNMFHESVSCFIFNPCCSFIMDDKCNKQNIIDTITNIKNYYNNNTINNCDYINVNPYGLDKVVFAGGGSKGMLYLGCILGLFATGQLLYINHFIGTSAGAISSVIAACITPTGSVYDTIKTLNFHDIVKMDIISHYREALTFATERFCKRDINTFYIPFNYSFYGLWTAFDNIVKHNSLYDPISSGYHIWLALICKKICQIMNNKLDEYITIETPDGTIIGEIKDVNFIDVNSFVGWKLIKFFTFDEYNKITNKTIILTGTDTKKLTSVYYTNNKYKDLNVITGVMASISIPWVFKSPIIDEAYNFDGGIFDNYPITICDKKVKDTITHYNTKIFGYVPDDNIVIDAYEILRDLWVLYNGFITIININYLFTSSEYCAISELFFEIRTELYKLIFFSDINILFDIEHKYNIYNFENIISQLIDYEYKIPKMDIKYITSKLNILKMQNKKSCLTDIIECAIYHGTTYKLFDAMEYDLNLLSIKETLIPIEEQYYDILKYFMSIICYYEIKFAFYKNISLNNTSTHFIYVIKKLYNSILLFEKLTNGAVEQINKKNVIKIKNNIAHTIQIAHATFFKILKTTMEEIKNSTSYYTKPIDYFYNTDMNGILSKCALLINNKLNNPFNELRTIKLNPFETKMLHFDMDDNLKIRLLYEGYSKTIKYFAGLLHIMEITNKNKQNSEYSESFEQRYKNNIMGQF